MARSPFKIIILLHHLLFFFIHSVWLVRTSSSSSHINEPFSFMGWFVVSRLNVICSSSFWFIVCSCLLDPFVALHHYHPHTSSYFHLLVDMLLPFNHHLFDQLGSIYLSLHNFDSFIPCHHLFILSNWLHFIVCIELTGLVELDCDIISLIFLFLLDCEFHSSIFLIELDYEFHSLIFMIRSRLNCDFCDCFYSKCHLLIVIIFSCLHESVTMLKFCENLFSTFLPGIIDYFPSYRSGWVFCLLLELSNDFLFFDSGIVLFFIHGLDH